MRLWQRMRRPQILKRCKVRKKKAHSTHAGLGGPKRESRVRAYYSICTAKNVCKQNAFTTKEEEKAKLIGGRDLP